MDELYNIDPYCLDHNKKQEILLPKYTELTRWHYKNCNTYKRIIDITNGLYRYNSLEEIPFIPVRMFKEYDLMSVKEETITRKVISSGTTGQTSSRIYLDKKTAMWQQKALGKIVSDYIGNKRIPMLVIDNPSVIRNPATFTTRGSGILGFSLFATKRVFALKDDMSIDYDVINSFLQEYEKGSFLIFGFTFIIWKHFLLEIERKKKRLYDFSNAIMIHGGGWKKLTSESVSKEEFKNRFDEVCGLKRIHENYGMAEQTGSIFMECECGHLHSSIFSDVIIRNTVDFSPCEIGEKGIMQVMSIIPRSYPGHSLLTEDEGIIEGEDDCPCGRKGKYFRIIGRLKNAELRGCSDTYAAELS